MKSDKIDKVSQLGGLLYLRELQKVQSVLEEEARVTSDLKGLDKQDDTVAKCAVQLAEYHRLGADISWDRWSSLMRAAMNSQLAQLRVQKATMMTDVANAFGRREAMAELSRNICKKAMIDRQKKQVETLNNVATYKNGTCSRR